MRKHAFFHFYFRWLWSGQKIKTNHQVYFTSNVHLLKGRVSCLYIFPWWHTIGKRQHCCYISSTAKNVFKKGETVFMLINLEEKKEGGEEEMQEIKSERKKEKDWRKRKERREASRTHLFKHNIQPCRWVSPLVPTFSLQS